MSNLEDYKTDVEMYLKQIIALSTLMLETDNFEMANIMTIRDISELGLKLGENLILS